MINFIIHKNKTIVPLIAINATATAAKLTITDIIILLIFLFFNTPEIKIASNRIVFEQVFCKHFTDRKG